VTDAGKPLWRRARIFGQRAETGYLLAPIYTILLFWMGAGVEEYFRLADPGGRPYPLWAAPLAGLLGAVVLIVFTWPIDLLLAGSALALWWLLVARTLPAGEPRRSAARGPEPSWVRKRIDIDPEDADLLLGLCEPGSTLEEPSITEQNYRRFVVAQAEAERQRRLETPTT
jgi:hypothetical protein